jgi:chromate transporter
MILLDLFLSFLQIGLFTIGGGYAMIPLITDRVVSRGWATHEQLIDWIVVGESLPGAFAINIANFVGTSQYGLLGAAVAVAGLITPSFIIILIIAKFLTRFMEYKGVTAALRGLHPAALGLIFAAAVSIGITAFNISFSPDFYRHINLPGIIIFAVILALSRIKKLKFNSYKIIITSAVLGIIFYSAIDLFNINLI